MKRTLFKTGDGSFTLQIPEWNEQYHSKHGAVAEALHVFIKEGFQYYTASQNVDKISILEIGFGTGLNCFLTYLENKTNPIQVEYSGVEAFPLQVKEVQSLNFPSLLESSEEPFLKMHSAPWEEQSSIDTHFQLTKLERKFSEINSENEFDLIYFDAFGIRVQPELWTEEIFKLMYIALNPGGILVTYAANGSARRALISVGFEVDRIPGPPGKREMMRAFKRK